MSEIDLHKLFVDVFNPQPEDIVVVMHDYPDRTPVAGLVGKATDGRSLARVPV